MEMMQEILEKSKYAYEVIQHEKQILSRQDGSKYFGIEVGQTASTLILKNDKGFFALIVSGSRSKVNFEKIADILGCSKVKLASREEVQKVTGFQIGNNNRISIHTSSTGSDRFTRSRCDRFNDFNPHSQYRE